MSDAQREEAIRRCEAIMAEAGLASLIVASDTEGHSYGLQVPPESLITMAGSDDVIVPTGAGVRALEAEMARFGGLASGGVLLVNSLSALLRIVAKHIDQTRASRR